MLERTKSGNFYSSDQSIAAGATHTTASDAIDCGGYEKMGISLVVTGANASSNGTITFKFVTSVDGSNYEDAQNATSYTITVSGTTVRRLSINLDVQFIKNIKILEIVNGDATYAITANVAYYMEAYQ